MTARTYPVPSSEHIELVCTGGITDGGEWRRLFPVPLRYLDDDKQYRTYDVVEVTVGPAADGRPESRRPKLETLRVVDHVKGWEARCQWVKPTILPSIRAMKAANRTIGAVAVRDVLSLEAAPAPSEWTLPQKEKLRQLLLFDERKPLEKVPYDFRFIWKDGDGEQHDSLVIAWETCQTWRMYRHEYENPIQTMRTKWLGDLCGPERESAFFVGNLANRRQIFVICGWFCPPKKVSQNETLW